MSNIYKLYIHFMVWLGAAPPLGYEYLLQNNSRNSLKKVFINGFALLAVVFYIAIIVGLNVILVRALARYIELNQFGVSTQASVIEGRFTSKVGCSVDYSYNVVGKDRQITSYKGSDGIPCSALRELKSGVQFEILYVPSNPTNSGIRGYSSVVTLIGMILLLDIGSAFTLRQSGRGEGTRFHPFATR